MTDESPAIRYRAAPDVVSREVGGEAILLDLESGLYFGLNEVGGVSWQQLDSGTRSLGELCDAVSAEFDADQPRIEADVTALMAEMVAQNLVEEITP